MTAEEAIEAIKKGHIRIVMCKECVHWLQCKNVKAKYCEYAGWLVGANGYCVYGERRRI